MAAAAGHASEAPRKRVVGADAASSPLWPLPPREAAAVVPGFGASSIRESCTSGGS